MPDKLSPSSRSTREQGLEQGRLRREILPRSEHAHWSPDSNRPGVVDLIRKSNLGRLAELVPFRNDRMLVFPLTFFRGMAISMAYDLGRLASTGMIVQSCGDCHLQNVGWFGRPECNIIFDVTDFAETMAAPREWDLKRLFSLWLSVCSLGRFFPTLASIATEGQRD